VRDPTRTPDNIPAVRGVWRLLRRRAVRAIKRHFPALAIEEVCAGILGNEVAHSIPQYFPLVVILAVALTGLLVFCILSGSPEEDHASGKLPTIAKRLKEAIRDRVDRVVEEALTEPATEASEGDSHGSASRTTEGEGSGTSHVRSTGHRATRQHHQLNHGHCPLLRTSRRHGRSSRS
jgi:hypothetical protein